MKIVVTHAGIITGPDGMSAHGIEDLALMCSLVGFTVVVPADAAETVQAVRALAEMDGPCYLRLSRPATPIVCPSDYQFRIGQATVFRPGTDVTIVATGIMVAMALEAAETLARDPSTPESLTCQRSNRLIWRQSYSVLGRRGRL